MRRAVALSTVVAGVLIASAVASGCSSPSTTSSSAPSSSPSTASTATGSPTATASAAAATTITIGLPNSSPSFANSDVAVAQAEGYFKQEGLVVNVDNLSSGVPVVQGVVGGSLQIGASSIEPVVNAAAAGASLQVIGSYADKLTVNLVTDNAITAPAQLRGKRLGIQAVGAFREIMTRMVLQSAGLTTSDVTYVPSASTAYISELLAGEIQSGVLQEEQTLKALKKDKNLHVLVNFEKAFPDYFYGAYVANASWLTSNEVTAGKFLAAITLAHRFIYDNEAAAVAIIAKNTGYPAATITKAYQVLTSEQAIPVNSGLSATRLGDTITTMKQYKTLTGTAPAVSSLLNTTIIDAVLARLGTLGKPLDD
jgi:ABC-type nitrate/sulfonate/bicarbonate transport system substrate-binding protein